MNQYEFVRKNDYSQEVVKEAKDLLDEGILVVPEMNCLKGYWKGLVLIDRLTDKCYNLLGNSSVRANCMLRFNRTDARYALLEKYAHLNEREDRKEYFWDHIATLKDIIEEGMTQDKERETLQIIALNNMTFDDDAYSVCGWEVTIPRDDMKIPGKGKLQYKKPKINLVLVHPSKKKIILAEYKCNGSTMVEEDGNIEELLKDYRAVKDSEAMGNVCVNLLKAYNIYRCIKGKKEISLDVSQYTVKFGFLFVDKADPENCINNDEYKKGMSMIQKVLDDMKEPDRKKIVYIRAEKPDDLKLDEWKEVYGSDFKITVGQGLSGRLL